jgi:hypothetical protein
MSTTRSLGVTESAFDSRADTMRDKTGPASPENNLSLSLIRPKVEATDMTPTLLITDFRALGRFKSEKSGLISNL